VDEPQVSNNWHPMDGALVGAGSLWPQCCFVFLGVEGTVAPLTGTYTVAKVKCSARRVLDFASNPWLLFE